MFERILFNVVALGLFLFLFFRMVQKNDTNYLYILALQALGITISFIGLIIRIQLSLLMIILTYFLSIIIPIIVILIERKGITLTEVIFLSVSKFYEKIGMEEKSKQVLLKLVEKNSKSYHGHKALAEIYEKQNELEIASEEYIRAANIRPNEDKLQYKIADLFHKLRKSRWSN